MPEIFIRRACRLGGISAAGPGAFAASGAVVVVADAEADRLIGLGLARLATPDDAVPAPPPEDPAEPEDGPPARLVWSAHRSVEGVVAELLDRVHALEAQVWAEVVADAKERSR